MGMKLSGKDRQVVHECLIAVSRRPPWVDVDLTGELLDLLVDTWPDVDPDPDVLELVGSALRICARVKEADDHVSVPRKELESLWARIEKGEATVGPPDPKALLERSRWYDRIDDRDAAQVFRLRALDAAADQDDPDTSATCLTDIAYREWGRGGLEGTRQSIQQAIPLLGKVKDAAALGEILLPLARALESNGIPVVPRLLEKALQLLLESDLKRLAAECLELLAAAENDSATAHLERAVSLFDASGSMLGVLGAARALRRLAEITQDTDHALEAIRRLRSFEPSTVEAGVLARASDAKCLEVLGDIFRERGDDDRTVAQYMKSLEILEGLDFGDARGVRAKLNLDREDGPTLHPSIKSDRYMTVYVSRRAADASDDAVECPRRPRPCGVCLGEKVRCVSYRDDTGLAIKKYFMRFLCEDCGNYTSWDYED